MRTLSGLALAGAMIAASIAPASAQYYGNGNIPPGSYQSSCTNIVMRGNVLRATCNSPNGSPQRTSLDVSNCANVTNTNGTLQCARYMNGRGYYNNNGNGYYNGNGNGYGNRYGYGRLPRGDYQQSCTNIRVNGSQLSASCTATNGQRVYSTINFYRCNGRSIANENGYLRC